MNDSPLELREMPSGALRDYLDGSPIHPGDRLLMWTRGQYVIARYEIVDSRSHAVVLYGGDGQAYPLDRATMRFRWPRS